MPITQDQHLAMATIADKALKIIEEAVHWMRPAIEGDPAALRDRLALWLTALPRFSEESRIVATAMTHYKYTAHANRRRAAKGRLARGTAQEGDAAFTTRMRAKPQPKTISSANAKTIDIGEAPPMPHLEPGDYVVREDGAIISELPAPQALDKATMDKVEALLAQPVLMPMGHIPNLLKRIPKAPSTLAAEEAARQALKNGGGED